jgi:hypothetical protein
MDELDKYILGTDLKDGWRATGIHEIQRDQPNRCRTYLATNQVGELGFVKVLPPSTDNLEQMRLHLEEFYSEKEIVELCGKRNLRRIVRAIAFDKLEAPGIVPITIHYLIFEWAQHDMRALATETWPRHFMSSISRKLPIRICAQRPCCDSKISLTN